LNASDKNSANADHQADPQADPQAEAQASDSSVASSSPAEEVETSERREFYPVTNDLPVIEPAIAELRRLRLRSHARLRCDVRCVCIRLVVYDVEPGRA